MAQYLNTCRFNPVSGGLGSWVVSSAALGMKTPAGAGATNLATYKYRAESADLLEWEEGEGVYTVGTVTLTRVTILASSAAGAKVNFTLAPEVMIVALKEDLNDATNLTSGTLPDARLSNTIVAAGPIGGAAAVAQVTYDAKGRLTTVTSVPIAIAHGAVSGVAHGQCLLEKSGANLRLSPYHGNLLTVNGVACTVPDAGVSLAPTSLSVGTTYFIYAVATAGAITSLEASTTAHATSTTAGNKGVEIKSADNTRTLVGMARIISGPAWVDTVTQRFVRSWFNAPPLSLANAFTANRSTTSTSYVEVSTEIRAEFLVWPNELVDINLNITASHATMGENVNAGVGFDGATVEEGALWFSTPAAGYQIHMAARASKIGLAEGYHYTTLLGHTSAGTATYRGGSLGARTSLTGSIMPRR